MLVRGHPWKVAESNSELDFLPLLWAAEESWKVMSPVNSIPLSAFRSCLSSKGVIFIPGPRLLYLAPPFLSEIIKKGGGGAEKSPPAVPFIWYASPARIVCHPASGRKRGQIKSGCQDTRFAVRWDALYCLGESSDWKDKRNLISHSALQRW